jgi:hypothetical protein
VFCCRDQHTLFHQACGIADARYVASRRFHLEVIQIRASEDDSGPWRGGKNPQPDRGAAVETYARTLDFRAYCLLLNQAVRVSL